MIIRKEGIGITETSRKKDIIDPVEDCVVHQFDTRILDSGSRMLKILDLCNYRDILWNSTDPVSEGRSLSNAYYVELAPFFKERFTARTIWL